MSFLESVIAVVAPPDCMGCGSEGTNLCSRCRDSSIMYFGERCGGCNILSPGSKTCPKCRAHGLPSKIWIGASYKGPAQRLVYRYKFDHSRSVADSIATLMLEALPPALNLDEYVVVHIPTATVRVRERSFDHCQLLAKQISGRLGLKRMEVLGRLGQDTQVGSSRSQRIVRAQSQYYVKNHRTPYAKKILLIDDVMTTGATLTAATRALRHANAVEVSALIFAKKL